MKKQILFVTLLALFAGTLAYGQAINGSAPRGILCVDNPLNPIAGKEYTYQAASNQTGNYTFWATRDVNFISTAAGVTTTNMATTKLTTASGDLLTASANYAASNAADNVKITWSDAVLSTTTAAAPTFVAVNQEGTCTNNFKVWAITPVKAFTVDILNMENSAVAPLAYGANEDQCFDQVRGATYNTAASQMEYNYGTQVLYFEVIAANFTASWTPTFTLAGLGSGQTAVIEWAYDAAFTNPASPVVVTSGVASATPVTTLASSTTNGVSIYVRVTISNNTFQGITAVPITMTVDGVNSVGDWDIENNTLVSAGPLCNPTSGADNMDVATQTINPRPAITSPDPLTPLAPGNETN
jgi:hypothetical protein